jgi:hypothetical protein
MFETMLRHPIIASKNTFFWFKIRVLGNIFFNEGEKCVKKLILKRRKGLIKNLCPIYSKISVSIFDAFANATFFLYAHSMCYSQVSLTKGHSLTFSLKIGKIIKLLMYGINRGDADD